MVRVTSTRQIMPAATCPPEREIEVSPSTALRVPPQSEIGLAGAASVTPLGNSRVKVSPVEGEVLALLSIVKASVVQLPAPISAGERLIPNAGGELRPAKAAEEAITALQMSGARIREKGGLRTWQARTERAFIGWTEVARDEGCKSERGKGGQRLTGEL
jgi:hypothetical protein